MMDRFYGFDLGDAESAVTRLDSMRSDAPEVLKIRDTFSVVTAYALLTNGELRVGESACYAPDAVHRRIRFKSRFLTDPESTKDVTAFAAGILGELYESGSLIKGEDTCFDVGCPAGWDKNARERYREIFEKVGYPPVRIISESRAALVAACQSRHLQVGQDILSRPVLVVDIGSSTTDFAYICSGKEVELQTAGEVALGGGLMDAMLLEECVAASSSSKKIRAIFEESAPWQSYCEFAARRLKEKYYSDETYWETHPCVENVMIRYGKIPVKLQLKMDADMAHRLTEKKMSALGGKSFHEVFSQSLKEVRDGIEGEKPELLFMTGGVSKLPAIRSWCEEAFPEAVVITAAEPEFSVARGLAYCGRIDAQLKKFREELEEFQRSDAVEDIVREHITDLYQAAVDVLLDPILEKVALPVFDRWRSGEIRKLADIDQIMQTEIEQYLHTEEARDLLIQPIAKWLEPVARDVEEYTVPICIRNGIPYKALSLTSYLSLADVDISIKAKHVFAVEEITFLIDTIISIIVGLLCGGSGLALIYSGLPGIIAGVFLSFLVLLLGKDKMEQALLQVDLPGPVRKLMPKGYFRSRLDSISSQVRAGFYDTLEKEKDEEISTNLINEISEQIELCLKKMAEIVEVPISNKL